MNPGAKSDPHDVLADEIMERFRAGRAAEFIYTVVDVRRGKETPVSIMLIPEPLIRDTGNGLLIVVAGRGSLMWNGQDRMNPFLLIQAGIRPMGLAVELATVLHKLVERLSPSLPLLTNQSQQTETN